MRCKKELFSIYFLFAIGESSVPKNDSQDVQKCTDFIKLKFEDRFRTRRDDNVLFSHIIDVYNKDNTERILMDVIHIVYRVHWRNEVLFIFIFILAKINEKLL